MTWFALYASNISRPSPFSRNLEEYDIRTTLLAPECNAAGDSRSQFLVPRLFCSSSTVWLLSSIYFVFGGLTLLWCAVRGAEIRHNNTHTPRVFEPVVPYLKQLGEKGRFLSVMYSPVPSTKTQDVYH